MSASNDWGWERHERDQRLGAAKLTMEQKLRWLEDAQRLVQRLQMARAERLRKRDEPS